MQLAGPFGIGVEQERARRRPDAKADQLVLNPFQNIFDPAQQLWAQPDCQYNTDKNPRRLGRPLQRHSGPVFLALRSKSVRGTHLRIWPILLHAAFTLGLRRRGRAGLVIPP